jgi:general stress protein 26
MEETLKKEIIDFVGRTKSILISAKNKNSIPIVKAVTKLGNDGLNRIYFSTSPETEFFKYYKENPRTSIYLFDDDPNTPYPATDEKYYSVSFIDVMEVISDLKIKQRFLSEYLSQFYPDGVMDKNYNLMCFNAESGKYFRGVTDNYLSKDFILSE